MISLKLRRFWQVRRQYAGGILACFCVLGLVPAGNAQTNQVRQLIRQLKDTDSDVRRSAAQALGYTKDPSVVEPLIAALKDTDSGVRRNAAYALGYTKDPSAAEPLIAALKDTDSGVRRGAAYALSHIKDPSVVEPLIAALKDTDSRVRQSAAYALGNTEDPRAIEPLNKALKDLDHEVRQSAGKALDNMGNIKAPERLGERAVRMVPYKDVGWRTPSSGEVIMAKIRSENSFFVRMGTLSLARVNKGGMLARADDVYVIDQYDRLPGFDSSLEAGRLAIEPIGGTSHAVKITSLDDKGFVTIEMSVVLPVGTKFEIEEMHWQDIEFDKGLITLRADGLEWRPR